MPRESEYLYADAAAAALITRPEHFQVVVTENMLGDILSDLAGGTVGGLGMCPSANIGDNTAYFEPIHGSAPDIMGKNLANPISQIRSAAMMLVWAKKRMHVCWKRQSGKSSKRSGFR
jgi:isocitrate/isopropylmalate dehydrogenase